MGKTNSLFNLVSQQPEIDKIYLYAKDPHEGKYQFLINKQESTSSKHFNDSNVFIHTQMIGMIFIKILKNTIRIKNAK